MSSPAPALRPILIADDNCDDLFFTCRIFHKAGIQNPLVTAEDGAEAIDYLIGCINTGHLPCLALIDIKMPRMSGFEVLEWAREQPALANVGFMILSSSNLPEDRGRAAKLGAFGYLVKYATAEQLAELVRQHCPHLIASVR